MTDNFFLDSKFLVQFSYNFWKFLNNTWKYLFTDFKILTVTKSLRAYSPKNIFVVCNRNDRVFAFQNYFFECMVNYVCMENLAQYPIPLARRFSDGDYCFLDRSFINLNVQHRPVNSTLGPPTAPDGPDCPRTAIFQKKYVKVMFLDYLFIFTIKWQNS